MLRKQRLRPARSSQRAFVVEPDEPLAQLPELGSAPVP